MRAFPSVRAFIQKKDQRTIELFRLPVFSLNDEPDLDQFRSLIEATPLGDVDKDIFFPNWTKSLHVIQCKDIEGDKVPTFEEIEEKKKTIDTPEKLADLLKKEEESPGCTAIIVQQCRSRRYSRKKEELAQEDDKETVSGGGTKQTRQGFGHTKKGDRSGSGLYNYSRPQVYTSPGFDEGGVLYYDQAFLPIGLVSPPPPAPIYSPCYAIPVNMGCYNYVSAPALVPPAFPQYYTY